ncbi:hypothetical protein [Streptomyces phaeochromogenes]
MELQSSDGMVTGEQVRPLVRHHQHPTALVKAITQSVSDPAPLPRWRDSTLPGLREAAQLTPVTPPALSVPTPLDIQRARTRRPPALGTRSVPRWSTATLPPAPAAPHTATRR